MATADVVIHKFTSVSYYTQIVCTLTPPPPPISSPHLPRHLVLGRLGTNEYEQRFADVKKVTACLPAWLPCNLPTRHVGK